MQVTVRIPYMPQRLPIFTLFPVLFSIAIMWIISGELHADFTHDVHRSAFAAINAVLNTQRAPLRRGACAVVDNVRHNMQ